MIFLSCDFVTVAAPLSVSEMSPVNMAECVSLLHSQPEYKLRMLLSCFVLDSFYRACLGLVELKDFFRYCHGRFRASYTPLGILVNAKFDSQIFIKLRLIL